MTEKVVEHVKDVELSSLQKAFVAGFIAFIAWMGVTVYTMSIKVAVTSSQVDQLVAGVGDRYTATQAVTDKRSMTTRIEAVERRLERLEDKHGL